MAAMWTEEHRRTYRREEEGYPSDLRDAEWVRLEPLIPEASPGGRPRKTDMRAAMNAILYLLRTGCPWRYLPRDSFPRRSTTSPASSSVREPGRRSGPSCLTSVSVDHEAALTHVAASLLDRLDRR
jgi:transposase